MPAYNKDNTPRKFNGKMTVETLEKKLGVVGVIRHESGRKVNKNKRVTTIRNESR